ncbi:FAD:protein FMN transferase [Candidatus Peregrinibacteria bacterium]|nr:FAD:protein FMN transferase [Candidatus Peregrinibacteria bacterium]
MQLIAKECDVLGTKVWIKVVGETVVEEAVDEAFAWAKKFEAKYSRFGGGNFLANLNARVGNWVEIDEELFGLLKFADELKKKTEGAFDLSVKGILEDWGYDAQYSFKEKNGNGDLGAIEFSKDGDRRVKFSSPIELGGIGKGYAVDKMAEKLEGFSGFFVNAGGDILVKGRDEKGEKWRIYFEHPTDPEQTIGFVDADNLALACSSPSKRKWGDKHHLVDPRTKKPADKMLAVYTQAKTCLLADAYATALFVMGYARAREFLEKVGLVEAMLVDVSGEIFRTKGFQEELFGE